MKKFLEILLITTGVVGILTSLVVFATRIISKNQTRGIIIILFIFILLVSLVAYFNPD